MRGDPSRARRVTAVALVALGAVGPVGYPLWLKWRTRGLPEPHPPDPPPAWPPITVVVPAYREREVIGHKVRHLQENGYPGELTVLVVAEDAETAAAAQETDANVVWLGHRQGKAGALNTGMARARTELVVLTDANAMPKPGALARLVQWFADPSVGAVAGEKRIVTETGESLYWAFESWLKRHEARTGTSISLGGELVALRRAAYRDLPTDIAVDDLWLALDVIEQGWRVVYDAEATAYEDPSGTVGTEFERRTRIICGALDVMWRKRALLHPRHGTVAAQLWGHRLIRSSIGPLAHAGVLALAAASAHRSALARAALAAQTGGALALLRETRGAKLGRLGRLSAQVTLLQAAGFMGTVRWAFGDRPARWRKPERSLRADVIEFAQRQGPRPER